MNKYYEIKEMSEKPEKEGRYALWMDGAEGHPTAMFKNGQWFTTSVNRKFTHYLKPISSLPIDKDTAGKIKETVAEVMKESEGGLWQPCTGCYETEDGHDVGEYQISQIFQCKQGGGCHECGGIGVVWNDYTNYPEPTKQ